MNFAGTANRRGLLGELLQVEGIDPLGLAVGNLYSVANRDTQSDTDSLGLAGLMLLLQLLAAWE